MSGDELDLAPERVAELTREGRLEVIDVREPYERAAGHLPGSRHVELGRLTAEAESLPRDRPVVFYCRVGSRSAMAAQAFRASGWEAYSMSGGIIEWAQRGLALDPPDGHVADH
jgi:rhodanese-related sulfurtransferase